MPEPHSPVPGHPENPEVEHEYSDVNVRGIVWFGVGMALAAAVIHVVLWWLHQYLAAREQGEPLPPPAAELRPRLPDDVKRIPEPRLEIEDSAELERLRAEENARLDSYGWIDRDSGIVHIPITRAMQLLTRPGALAVRSSQPKGGN